MINRAEWDQFLVGHWQREQPQRAGVYPQATGYAPYETGPTMLGTIFIHPETNKPTSVRPWGGFWWSEPTPTLPAPAGPNQPWRPDGKTPCPDCRMLTHKFECPA